MLEVATESQRPVSLKTRLSALRSELERLDGKIRELIEDTETRPENLLQGGVSVRKIIDTVAADYRVTHGDILSTRREPEPTEARLVVYHLCRELTSHSNPVVARYLGDRDHTTVWRGIQNLKAKMKKKPALAARVSRLMEACRGAK